MTGGTERMEISAPASPMFLRAVQSTASSVAAQLHFTCDRVWDLRLALEEACAYLIDLLPEDSLPVVSLSILVDDAKLAVEVQVHDSRPPRPHAVMQTPGPDGEIRLALLQALVDEVCVVCDTQRGMCVTLNCFRCQPR